MRIPEYNALPSSGFCVKGSLGAGVFGVCLWKGGRDCSLQPQSVWIVLRLKRVISPRPSSGVDRMQKALLERCLSVSQEMGK